MRRLHAVLLAFVLSAGCGRSEPARPGGSSAAPVVQQARHGANPPAAASPAASSVASSPGLSATQAAPIAASAPLGPRLDFPAAELVVALGDLHGDLAATRRALRLAGAIDAHDHWVGGALVVVQTGDILDRGDDERAILDLTDRLRVEARAAGGAFIGLSGNHEVMNVAQDFRYVTPAGFGAFAPEGGRDVAFRPGGSFATRLAERPIVAKVGDTVFVHAGVLPKHVSYGLARMSDEVRAWMLGQRSEPPAIVVAEDGLIWTRVYSMTGRPADCEQLAQTLAMLGAKRMVVGHTPQSEGINAACDGRVWRIDVGLAHHYGGPTQVLEIRGDAVKVRAEQPVGAREPASAPPDARAKH